MNDAFTEMLLSWEAFYFTLGGASASLAGLMFVSLSIGINLVSDELKQNFKSFVTPSIVYFVTVFLVSMLMLIPIETPRLFGLVLSLFGIAGVVTTIVYVRQLVRIASVQQDFNLGDWLAQVVMPIVSYVLLILTALAFAIDQWSPAFAGACIATLLLLICAIANTWSVVVWTIEHR